MTAELKGIDPFMAYGMSKAAVATYTIISAREHPNFKINSITPGYIDTAIVSSMKGDKKPPEEGTVSIKRCLFEDCPGNGRFYGSDGLRSPLNKTRNPGDPEYLGI